MARNWILGTEKKWNRHFINDKNGKERENKMLFGIIKAIVSVEKQRANKNWNNYSTNAGNASGKAWI